LDKEKQRHKFHVSSERHFSNRHIENTAAKSIQKKYNVLNAFFVLINNRGPGGGRVLKT
jgi:hypothetical protein